MKKILEFIKDKKDKFENIVVLGVGGSALGTRALMQTLKGKYYNELSRKKRGNNPKLYILDNVDPKEIDDLIQILDLKETLFIVISKSGGTIETMSIFTFFKEKIKKLNLKLEKHFVIIAGENSDFKKKSLEKGYNVFDIPEGIGGRFSAFTNVGLLPLAFIGIDIEQIVEGVKNIKKTLLSDNIFENPALLTAIIQYHTYFELNKNITVFFPYAGNLFFLGEWYKQMMGESLGKGGIGVTTTSAIGTTDQHSQLQLYYDGPNG
ncbi:MAG: hypothetical protein Q9M97_09055 [Candidatus Gracilibacteria bacterium]|nr:hypothetical protein [Candidatus Gracilibacteria bacterium]